MSDTGYRIHYLTSCPARYYPTDADLSEILCGDPDPDDWTTGIRGVTCPDCLLLLGMPAQATTHRHAETIRP